MASTEHITTAEQLWGAPGLGRCELLRGELVMMSPSGAEHGYVVVNVTVPLAAFVKVPYSGYSGDTIPVLTK